MTDYQLMYQTSPVQKERIVNPGDLMYNPRLNETFVCVKGVTFSDEYVKIYRQEDWQEIYETNCLTKNHPVYLSQWILLPENVHTGVKLALTAGDNARLYWTILWCLFVHKEAYGLVWDWEEKKWQKG